ncbi:NAD(P)/FAD-dependent oxidoreductase [Kribbella solani]|uniref:NAD(P)/FAD-dependent oxidoreductase n=1 Tax=Kribbella solani TaxID=236067 RepID=UPI0029B6CA04|nr:NAD(P)/FAD-dependent oxidoreductase [Kribbella solani]MDX2971418.1 NAD(P)/FAD-dependent oxidoreductase [Kribbella solani]MDX3004137.1 NAD(P)/FAD-dependent oxidoreductase [Kribbella solani]
MTAQVPHILVVGGGYVGMYTAYGLRRAARKGRIRVTVVDPRSVMTYQPFLPEAAAGSVEPRHVVVPLRKTLKGCRVVTGRVTGIDHAGKVAKVLPEEGPAYELAYDQIVVALGSIARTLPIPGLAEEATGFKNVEEAIALRNKVLDRLDVASSQPDPVLRKSALTFVFVGGGYAGVEAFAELEDMARYATRYYDNINPEDMRWVLVEATGRILPEVGEELGKYTVDQLRKRNMEIRLETRLESCEKGHVILSDGDEFDADTIVWTAGVKANPALAATDFPLDEKGRVKTLANLRIEGVEDAWTAGDNAAVPDLTGPAGTYCAPNAQHAVRQARRLAANILRVVDGQPPQDYEHKYVGSVASLGLHKGVAQLYGVKVKGWLAWFLHRTYHVSRVPTFNRKMRVILDWTLALFFRREVTSLGSLQTPNEEFQRATQS